MPQSFVRVSGRIRVPALSCLVALLAALCAAAAPAQAASPAPAADALGAAAEAHASRPVEVIVRLDGTRTAAQGRAAVRRHHGRVTGDLHLIHALAARMAARDAAALRRDPAVESVAMNRRMLPQSINGKDLRTAYPFSIGAPTAWNSGSAPATGRGVGVAVIDTGIDGTLADFRVAAGDSHSRVVGSAVTNPNATTAADTYGHGTHVAGILAGNGNLREAGDPLVGGYVGIAPEANLISIKVSDDAGGATILDVIYGLQFAVDHKADYNIRVVNLSLESTAAGSARTDPLDAAAEATWFAGIAVVAAAGNRGSNGDAVQYAPGNDPYVITVGASDDVGTRSKDDDVIASWSSRGTTQDGYAKPDVYAPGAHMVSTLATSSAFAQLCPSCVVSGAYFQAGGTSMSAPVVAGVAALVVERRPGITPDQLKSVLMRSSRVLPGGFASVDADGAVRAALASSLPSANTGLNQSTLIDPATGGIDYTKSSWSRSSWSTAPSDLSAQWAKSSWSCDCSLTSSGTVDPTRSSWSRSSWSTSWTR